MNIYTNEQVTEAKGYLVEKLVGIGVFNPDDQDAKIAEIVESIPPASLEEYGDSPEVQAANFFETWAKVTLGETDADDESAGTDITTQQQGNVAETGKKEKAEFHAPALSEEAAERARELVTAMTQKRISNTSETEILKLLVEDENPEKLYKGVQVIPDISDDKLKEYEANLVQDEENIKAFEEIKAAIGKKKMPVYINTKSRRVAGVLVSTPAETEGKSQKTEIQLKKDRVAGFLTTKVMGLIPTGKIGLGLEITKIAAKSDKKHADATAPKGVIRVRWAGKSQVIEDGTNLEVINTQSKVGKDLEYKKGKLRIEKTFKIKTDRRNTKNEVILRTVRPSGEYDKIPVYVRKDEFKEVFGEIADRNVVSAYIPKDKQEEIERTTMDILASAQKGKLEDVHSLGKEFQDMVLEIEKASKSAAATATASFE